MSELVDITTQSINGKLVKTVSARELWAFLEIKSRFNDWIKYQIKIYYLLEGVDYATFTENLAKGGRLKEYFLTLNVATELAMIRRNDKGRQLRQYFTEIENRFQEDRNHE